MKHPDLVRKHTRILEDKGLLAVVTGSQTSGQPPALRGLRRAVAAAPVARVLGGVLCKKGIVIVVNRHPAHSLSLYKLE
jgi:hypothetical protein